MGGGKTIRDWEARFELAHEKCKDEDGTPVGDVAPATVRFARYLHRTHCAYPRDLWQTQIVTLGGVPGINARYKPARKALYGPGVIREIYGATEGLFGQQRDERRAWMPNHDLCFFEVEIRPSAALRAGSGIKMLYEMRPGERGSLVVSTPILPRYKIGDLILVFHPPYFRCIGRDQWWTVLRYAWDEFTTFNLGQLQSETSLAKVLKQQGQHQRPRRRPRNNTTTPIAIRINAHTRLVFNRTLNPAPTKKTATMKLPTTGRR